MSARFVFAATQAGAERSLKNEIARDHPTLRFAFSRPGFVTFRLAYDGAAAEEPPLRSVFARTWGYSLGKALGPDDAALARAAWQIVKERWPNNAAHDLRHLHVWQRARSLPGDEGYDTESAELERAAGPASLG